MRDEEDRFTPLANVVLIGQGDPTLARDFCEARRVRERFHCMVAPQNRAYREFGLDRGSVMQVAGPRTWLPGARTFFGAETHQGRTRGDPMQLAGTFVIDPSGTVRYAHRNQTSADNPSNEDVLDALERITEST